VVLPAANGCGYAARIGYVNRPTTDETSSATDGRQTQPKRVETICDEESEGKKMAKIEIKVPDWLDKICVWPTMLYRRYKFGYSFRKIDLGEGRYTIVDAEDYYRYGKMKWHIGGHGTKFYAVRTVIVANEEIETVRLHREIMKAPEGLLVDHRNGDSLDNRRDNLRLATHSQNTCNNQKRKNTSSRFLGVYLNKEKKRWAVHLRHQGKRIFLGYFDSELEAARAYDRAAIKFHGEFARLNFPREDYNDEIYKSREA